MQLYLLGGKEKCGELLVKGNPLMSWSKAERCCTNFLTNGRFREANTSAFLEALSLFADVFITHCVIWEGMCILAIEAELRKATVLHSLKVS